MEGLVLLCVAGQVLLVETAVAGDAVLLFLVGFVAVLVLQLVATKQGNARMACLVDTQSVMASG